MIRCLVVDDARAFRAVLRHILASAPGVEVVGEAADGREAVALVRSLRPDVVTMDVRMPHLDGLAAIEEIMRVAPTPVIVVSAEAGEEAQQLSFRALQFGAIEVLAKPRDPGTPGFDRQAEAIRQAVRAVAGLVLVGRRHTVAAPQVARRVGSPPVHGAPGRPPGRPEVLALAASTGGPAALREILSRLPADLPVPLLVVQHIAPGFEGGLARWLAAAARLDVRLAEQGAELVAGTAYLGACGRHLGVRGRRIQLGDGPPIQGFRPSASHLFESVAQEFGARGAGIVLTGMGRDGADGLEALRRAGGYTAAQSAASSVVFGMPRAALECGAAVRAFDLDELPAEILRLVGRVARPAGPPA